VTPQAAAVAAPANVWAELATDTPATPAAPSAPPIVPVAVVLPARRRWPLVVGILVMATVAAAAAAWLSVAPVKQATKARG
jgi:uncharacterized protein involved in exopolysaccharide biosynthesis